MEYRSVKGMTGWAQLGILLVFTGAGFILAGIVQLIIALQLVSSGLSMDKMGDAMIKAMLRPENITYSRIAQVSGTFLLLFFPWQISMYATAGINNSRKVPETCAILE